MKGVPSPVAFDYVAATGIRCRNDNVLVRWDPIPETTPSGLVALPRDDYARAIDGKSATVVAVGPGPSYRRKCEKCGGPRDAYGMEVKPGDRVIVDNKYVGELVYVNGEEHRMVRENELLAVVEDG